MEEGSQKKNKKNLKTAKERRHRPGRVRRGVSLENKKSDGREGRS